MAGAGVLKYYNTTTPSSGNASFNTEDIRGEAKRIFVKPATATTSYNFTITDNNSLIIYEKYGIVGTLNDISSQTMKGIHTVAISAASADELFKVQIEWKEEV